MLWYLGNFKDTGGNKRTVFVQAPDDVTARSKFVMGNPGCKELNISVFCTIKEAVFKPFRVKVYYHGKNTPEVRNLIAFAPEHAISIIQEKIPVKQIKRLDIKNG